MKLEELHPAGVCHGIWPVQPDVGSDQPDVDFLSAGRCKDVDVWWVGCGSQSMTNKGVKS